MYWQLLLGVTAVSTISPQDKTPGSSFVSMICVNRLALVNEPLVSTGCQTPFVSGLHASQPSHRSMEVMRVKARLTLKKNVNSLKSVLVAFDRVTTKQPCFIRRYIIQ